jgi:hypothetical protein
VQQQGQQHTRSKARQPAKAHTAGPQLTM